MTTLVGTVTEERPYPGLVRLTCKSNASGVVQHVTELPFGRITHIRTFPIDPATGYNVALRDHDLRDVLNGLGASRSTSSSAETPIYTAASGTPVIDVTEPLGVAVSGLMKLDCDTVGNAKRFIVEIVGI